jgi:hypothetical protein
VHFAVRGQLGLTAILFVATPGFRAWGPPMIAQPLWRWLLVAAGLILTGTALLQLQGYPRVSALLASERLPAVWSAGMRATWLFFAVQLLVLAGFAFAAAMRPRLADSSALTICAVLLASNTALMGGFLGLFAGTILVGMATALVVIVRLIRMEERATE